jgi:hypothetical protein
MRHSKRLALAVLALMVPAALVAVGSPAQAEVTMTLRQRITVPGLIRHQIIAVAIMSQADAQSEIARGARFQVECWGADVGPDQPIPSCPQPGQSGIVTYSGSALIADTNGVRLDIVNFYEKGGALNEDLFTDDEIYVKARWIDAEGHTISLETPEISGSF